MIHSLKFSETLACRCCLSRNTIAVLLISFPPACRPSFAKAFAGQSVRPTCGSMLNISLGVCRPHQSSHRPVCFMTLQGVYHRGQVVCVWCLKFNGRPLMPSCCATARSTLTGKVLEQTKPGDCQELRMCTNELPRGVQDIRLCLRGICVWFASLA